MPQAPSSWSSRSASPASLPQTSSSRFRTRSRPMRERNLFVDTAVAPMTSTPASALELEKEPKRTVFTRPPRKVCTGSEYDIVAVHGLNGSPIGSWLHTDPITRKQTMWLTDVLPSRLPDVMGILSWGWEFDTDEEQRGTITQARIVRKAMDLLAAIKTFRSAEQTRALAAGHHGGGLDRPLLLIGDDIGGVIIKQALLIAKDNEAYRNIAAKTFRLVFFGTPHRSPDIDGWDFLALKLLLTSNLTKFSESFSKVIAKSAKALRAISEEFYTIAGRYSVVSFYEGKPSVRFGEPVVSVFSASMDIPSEEVIGLKGDHDTMCQFSSEDDEGLERVCQKLKYSSDKADEQAAYAGCLKILAKLKSGSSPSVFQPWEASTLKWILSNKDYIKWLKADGKAFLHIQGPVGSGKSVLANFLVDALRKDLDREKALVRFSFYAADCRRNSVRGMLLSLVHQLLSYLPALFRYVKPQYDDLIEQDDPWTDEGLWVFFRSIIACPGHTGVTLILDAADHCDSSFKQFLDDIMVLAASSGARFKVILTSRGIESTPDWITLKLNEQPENQEDIKQVVRSKLSELIRNRPAFREFEVQITALLCKPNTTFLCALLPLDYLDRVAIESTPASIQKALEPLECGLHEIYEHILQSIPRRLSPWASRALSWILHALRPLTTHELATALAIQPDSKDYTSIEPMISRDIAADLSMAFGCLVVIERDEVRLIHHSAREYLLARERVLPLMKVDPHEIYLVNPCAREYLRTHTSMLLTDHTTTQHSAQQHGLLARRCLAYLFMPELTVDPPEIDYSVPQEPQVLLPHTRKYGFLRYAVQFWPEHYRLAEKSPAFTKRVKDFLENKKQMHFWAELYWCLDPVVPTRIRTLLWPFHISAELGFKDLLEEYLPVPPVTPALGGNRWTGLALEMASRQGRTDVVERLLAAGVNDLEAVKWSLLASARFAYPGVVEQLVKIEGALADEEEMYDNPLHLAVPAGNIAVVKEILEAMYKAGLNCDRAVGYDMTTPLHLAALNGHAALVHELLGAGADVRAAETTDATPLHMAAERGHAAVVEILLEAEADPNVANNEETTPLHLAAQGGYLAVVQQLMKAGADPAAIDQWKQTPLHLAAAGGHLEVLEELLATEGVEADAVDQDNATALHLAARGGHHMVVKTLIKHDVSVTATDDSQRTPLDLAAEGGHLEVVGVLLQAGAEVDTADNEEFTPLHFAAKSGSVKVARKLIEAKASVTAVNHEEYTPLHLAAQYGYLEVVKELIKAGAAPDATGLSDNTPLHLAALASSVGVSRVLLEHAEVDVEAKNKDDRTPLSYAAEGGSDEIVQLLLQRDGVDPDFKDKHGRTPLSWAAQYERTEVVKVLLAQESVESESRDEDGRTPLLWAAISGCTEIVKMLLERDGVDPCAKDKDGRTPLSHVAQLNRVQCVKLLLEKMPADEIDVKDDGAGQTPMFYATKLGNDDVVALFLEHGGIDLNQEDKDGRTGFISACLSGHLPVVKRLIKHGEIEWNHKDAKGLTAIMAAALNGHAKIVKLLLEIEAVEPDTEDLVQRQTALSMAALTGRTEVVKLLIEREDVNLSAQDMYGRTPLLWACFEGHVDVVSVLLEKDSALLNVADNNKLSPLMAAAFKGRGDVVKHLLQRDDIQADYKDDNERSPLFWAAYSGNDEAVEALLARTEDVDPNAQDTVEWTAVHCAAYMEHEGCLKLLLADERVDPDKKDDEGRTPFSWAATKGATTVLKLLMESGRVDIESKDSTGRTPLMFGAATGKLEVVKLLLEQRDVDPVREDDRARTPLWYSATGGNEEIVRLLLEKSRPEHLNQREKGFGQTALSSAAEEGMQDAVRILLEQPDIDVNCPDTYGRSSLSYASSLSEGAVAKLLLDHGADPNLRNDDGLTPLHFAVSAGSSEVLQLLLEKGAGRQLGTEEFGSIVRSESYRGNTTTVQTLLDCSPGDVAKSDVYCEALQLACLKGHKEIVEKFLEIGVDAKRRDEHGWNAEMCALHLGDADILEKMGLPTDPADFEKLSNGIPSIPKPSKLSEKEKSRRMTILEDGMVVQYTDTTPLPEGQGQEPATVKANHPIPLDAYPFYWELDVLDHGDSDIVAIGLTHSFNSTTSIPGWLPGSWGYHGDDGQKYAETGSGTEYGETYTAGDTVGCYVTKSGQVRFTKNGNLLDVIAEGAIGRLVPAVGMRSYNAKAKVNFTGPFKWDQKTGLEESEKGGEDDVEEPEEDGQDASVTN